MGIVRHMNKPAIERRKDHKGRELFTINGAVSTYQKDEAEALADTGVHDILCPLTRELIAHGEPLYIAKVQPVAPNGHGTLVKFDWE